MEKAKDHQTELFMSFIDYKKAFAYIDHQILWCTFKDMGIPDHLIVVMRNIYTNQELTVRTEYGETNNIPISKGIRQGCILSSFLFNIYAERIMRYVLEK